MTEGTTSPVQTFWEHLEELRRVLFRILFFITALACAAFCLKETLFEILLAPKDADFITYRWLEHIQLLTSENTDSFLGVNLINTGLAEQFLVHVKAAFATGILLASPYILYQLYRFVSPALYTNERSYAIKAISSAYVMFLLGGAITYFLLFPLTFRFLGTYQVSSDVTNLISLSSYMSTFFSMSLAMGCVFEMPVLSWVFAKMGFLTSHFMRQYRRHVVIVLLILAAIITPTSDMFTLLLVAFPMWWLYEASILWVSRVEKHSKRADSR